MTRASDDTPEAALAQAFARQVQAWACATGAGEELAAQAGQAAHALSLSASQGHVCLDLVDFAGSSSGAVRLRAALLASGVAGAHRAPASFPLVLDDENRLYLHRDFDFERRLARRLALARAPEAWHAEGVERVRARLAELFGAGSPSGPDWQQLAAALALRNRFTVVSGGPGTGKTTMVVNLLACLLELEPDSRIALAAPTGKAAARLTEAVRQRVAQLDPATRERLPTQAATLHRLLRVGADGRVGHDAARPLPIDALVVDEASMIDLALATRLFEAVPPGARIILLGDKDQLAAVEAGAVFSELSADPTLSASCKRDLAALCAMDAGAIDPPPAVAPGPWPDTTVWFTRNFRFSAESRLGRLATLVKRGDAGALLAFLEPAGQRELEGLDDASAPASSADDVRWLGDAGHRPGAAVLQALEAGYEPYVDALLQDASDCAHASEAWSRFRVLCALRDGPRGVAGINAHMTRRLREALPPGAGHDDTSAWFVGRPVIVLDNDYVLQLFNGDIGLALPDEQGDLQVVFPDPSRPGSLRRVSPARLPRHDTAFAMTVHKAQGSEFDELLVLLPGQSSRVCTRELLYTAVTRARRAVTLAAPAGVLATTLASSTHRRSGLLARLREALSEPPIG